MKALIVYDSVYGNTEKVARAMASVFGLAHDVKAVRVTEANPSALGAIDLLIVGSPTHGGRPTPAIKEFVDGIPQGALNNVPVAAFDTRMTIFIARLLGYAAGRIAAALRKKGGLLAAAPGGFAVEEKEGPLRAGELERAAAWARDIANNQSLAQAA